MLLLFIVGILFMLYWIGWYAILMWLVGTAVVMIYIGYRLYVAISPNINSMFGKLLLLVIMAIATFCGWVLIGALPL